MITIEYESGYDLTVEIRNSIGKVYNIDKEIFENYGSNNYSIDATESDGTYSFDLPDLDDGTYVCEVYIDDTNVTFIEVVVDGSDITQSGNLLLNSYSSISDANVFFYNRITPAAWDDATNLNKAKALNMATAAIDKLNFIGEQTSTDQLLQFPRDDDTEYPTNIVQATCLCAVKYLDGFDLDEVMDELKFSKQEYGSVKQTFNNYIPPHLVAGIPSAEAWDLLLPFLYRNGEIRLNKIT